MSAKEVMLEMSLFHSPTSGNGEAFGDEDVVDGGGQKAADLTGLPPSLLQFIQVNGGGGGGTMGAFGNRTLLPRARRQTKAAAALQCEGERFGFFGKKRIELKGIGCEK
jgi:hypothetical protein